MRRGRSASPREDEAERELEAAQRFGARFVGIGEPDYPPALRQIDGAPPLLAVKGNLSASRTSRRSASSARATASISGAKFAAMVARDCGRAGYTIVSGLARGIDTAAHRASLDTGTIAVLAGGLDQPYPPENVGLLEEIWNRQRPGCQRNAVRLGAARTRLSPPQPADRRHLAWRRRRRGGSPLRLADHRPAAGEFGRLVFAVPGSPLDPRCHGTNGLLKDGAMIVTSAQRHCRGGGAAVNRIDLFRRTCRRGARPRDGRTSRLPPDETDRARIVDALGPTPVEIDDIIRHTGLSAAAVYLVLLELDIAGRLHRHAGGLVSSRD